MTQKFYSCLLDTWAMTNIDQKSIYKEKIRGRGVVSLTNFDSRMTGWLVVMGSIEQRM